MFHDALSWVLSRTEDVRWTAVAVALALHVLAVGLHATAWRELLRARFGRRARWLPLAGAYTSGQALNAVVPARAGLALKLFLARRSIPGSGYAGLATSILALAAFDTVVGASIALWAVAVRSPAALELVTGVFTSGWPALGAAVGIAVALAASVVVLRRVFPRLRGTLRDAVRSLAVLRTRHYLTRVLPILVVNWAAQLGALAAFLVAFGLPASLETVLLVQAARTLAALVAVVPSGAGIELALLIVLLAGIADASHIAGFAIASRAILTVATVGIGAVAVVASLGTLRWRRVLAREHAGTAVAARVRERSPS